MDARAISIGGPLKPDVGLSGKVRKLVMANRDKHGNSRGADRTLTLTAEARRFFIEALLNSPRPNEKATAAARRLKEGAV
jgi:hypothetical protein